MTTMINAKARFGLEGDKLFDYATSRYIKKFEYVDSDGFTFGSMVTPDGMWDMDEVASAIREGRYVEGAFMSNAAINAANLMNEANERAEALAAENATLAKRIRDLEAQLSIQPVTSLNRDNIVETHEATAFEEPAPDKAEQANVDFSKTIDQFETEGGPPTATEDAPTA